MDGYSNAPGPYDYMLRVPNVVSVTAPLPQEFALGVTASWEGNSAGSTVGDVAQNLYGGIGGAGAAAAGISSIGVDTLANRQWSGTSPLTFNLLAEFNARTNPARDVIVPILKLQSMCLPTRLLSLEAEKFSLGNVFAAPFFDTISTGQVGGRSKIELHIGNMFLFEDMVVEAAVPTYKTQMHSSALPLSAQVEIQVSTRRIFTFEDLLASIVHPDIVQADAYLQKASSAGGGSRAGYSGALPATPVKD